MSVVMNSISHSTADCNSTKFRPQRYLSATNMATNSECDGRYARMSQEGTVMKSPMRCGELRVSLQARACIPCV